MFEKYCDIVSVSEVCNMLRLSKPAVYLLLKSKEIEHKKFGKKYIIPKRCVISYLQAL